MRAVYTAGMADQPQVSEYVLTVHAPTKWDLTNYEAKRAFSFESPFIFIKSATPFHVPHVGHEISVAFDGKDWLGTEEPSPTIFVVTHVSHRIEASGYGVTCKLDVYTEQAPRPSSVPEELRRGRTQP